MGGSAPGREADSGFLVRDEVAGLLGAAGLTPSFHEHWMGWHWTVNYWRGRLRGGREPARLPMIVGSRDFERTRRHTNLGETQSFVSIRVHSWL